MSSLLVTFLGGAESAESAESGEGTGSFLAEPPRHGSREDFQLFSFSFSFSAGSDGSFSFSARPGGLTGGGGAGRLVESWGLRDCEDTGNSAVLCSISFCRIGAEISRVLRLLLSGFCLLLCSESSLPAFAPRLSLPRPELSGLVLELSR